MQILIYIQDKPVILCDQLNQALEQLHHRPDTIFIDELNHHTIKTMLHEITLPTIKKGIFLHHNLQELQTQFFKKFEIHVAGGGLVTNKKNEILLIFRNGFWDLPKGHLDAGETIEACAIREVMEETGLTHLQLLHLLATTYHTYQKGTHHILKQTHWYAMHLPSHQKTTPQTEEGIEAIAWVHPQYIQPYLQKSHPSIAHPIFSHLDSKH